MASTAKFRCTCGFESDSAETFMPHDCPGPDVLEPDEFGED